MGPQPAAPSTIAEDAPRVAEGRYVLLTRLGEGGMAVVYGAWDLELDLWRAIKVLLPEHARRRSVRRRFEREARTLMAIRHPNLVRVHEVRADRALPYLVMDLLPGGSLDDWGHRHGAMPAARAAEVGVQVCRGLEAAHGAGVIHRDVKPQNVLVGADDGCRLTDFGVARVAGGGGTRANVSMGTIGFMAPEQLADSRSVDVRCDVYAVGATLYVLATRRSVRDLFRTVDDPTLLEGIDAPLRSVLQRCLAYERDERWATAAELADALTEARARLPDLPPGTPPLARPLSEGAGPGGGAVGELTELEGLLEAVIPAGKPLPPRRADLDTEETPLTPVVPLPLPAVVQLEATVVPRTPPPPPMVTIAPPPPPPPAVAPPASIVRRGAKVAAASGFTALLGAAVLAGVVLLTLIVAAAIGRTEVADRAAGVEAAERIVAQRLRDEQPWIDDLERLGADAAPVRGLLGADGTTFARAVAAAARPVVNGRRADPEGEAARQRLERMVWAVDRLEQAEGAWREAAASLHGDLAIRLGLAAAPAE